MSNAAKDLRKVIRNALLFDIVDLGDTDAEVAKIFDGVRNALARDPRFPRLASLEFDLMFADVKHDAERAFEAYSSVDWSEAADGVIAAIAEHNQKDPS
jgi:hypothetical protein